jgi:hypothetical protein
MKRREFHRALLGLPLTAAIPGFGLGTAFAEGAAETEIPGGSITDVSGLKVGHCTLAERPTGCTVVLCDNGAVAGVDVRGAGGGCGWSWSSSRPPRDRPAESH